MGVTYRDIWLDCCQKYQVVIKKMNSGDELFFNKNGCFNTRGQPVLKFSKQFKNRIQEMERKGYKPSTGKVRFIVFWKKEGAEKEIRIVLPELYFIRDL